MIKLPQLASFNSTLGGEAQIDSAKRDDNSDICWSCRSIGCEIDSAALI